MSGPPYKWQWIESVDVDRDEANNRTNVQVNWRSKSQDEPEPESPVGVVDSSCGDCIVIIEAIREVDGFGIRSSHAGKNIGIPSVEDSGTVSLTLSGTRGELVYERSDDYGTDVDRMCNRTENGCVVTPIPEIQSVDISDVEDGSTNQYSFSLTNSGPGSGDVSVQAEGANVESISSTETLDVGETKEFQGSYSISDPGGKAELNITASSDGGRDSVTESATRLGPSLSFSSVSSPDRLCPGTEGDVSITVSNSGGEAEMTLSLTGEGFDNLDEQRVISAGSTESFSTVATMPNTDSIKADLVAQAFDETSEATTSVSKRFSKPDISLSSPEFVEPGLQLDVDALGTVENCENEGTISISGDVSETRTETVSPNNPFELSQTIKMPGDDLAFEADFDVLTSTSKASDTVKPENSFLIDTGNGLAVRAPLEVRNVTALIVGQSIEGAGQRATPEEIEELTGDRLAKVVARSPVNEARVLDVTISDREFKNVLVKNLKFVNAIIQQSEMAFGVNGEFKEKTNQYTFYNIPNIPDRLATLENNTLG